MTKRKEFSLPDDPHSRLKFFENAAALLMSGQRRVQIRHGDYWVEYSAGSLPELRKEIARLRAICGKRTAITFHRS